MKKPAKQTIAVLCFVLVLVVFLALTDKENSDDYKQRIQDSSLKNENSGLVKPVEPRYIESEWDGSLLSFSSSKYGFEVSYPEYFGNLREGDDGVAKFWFSDPNICQDDGQTKVGVSFSIIVLGKNELDGPKIFDGEERGVPVNTREKCFPLTNIIGQVMNVCLGVGGGGTFGSVTYIIYPRGKNIQCV